MVGTIFCFVGMLLGVVGLFGGDGPADEKPRTTAGQIELTTEQVVVFKDGYCLVVKDGVAKTDADGFAHTYDVPDAAVLGSFWAIPETGRIKSMVAGWEEIETNEEKEINCTDVLSIVKANVGRECSFMIGDEEFQGEILKLLTNPVDKPVETALADLRSSSRFVVSATPTSHFLLRSKVGDVMVAINQVKNLTIQQMVSTTKESKIEVTKKKKLKLDFGQPNQDVKIKLMYFRPDVRWIPTYRIELTDEPFESKSGKAPRNTAKIAMQGEILNEAEDFVDVPFHVVVGVPNFRFRTTPSPMVLEAQMQNSLASVAPHLMSNRGQVSNGFSNALYTQRAGEFRSQQAAGGNERAAIDMPEELSGKASQDLFVYKLDHMTLKKGERASVPILTTSVGYRDVYTWDIEIKHSESYAATSAGMASPLVLSENKVWRQIELVNDTDIPWTTGAAMFMDGFQPLAQELLTYTSPGGICRVPITVAIDLRGKVDDREVSRDLKALKWRGYSYTKVVGKINAELANNKSVKVPVEVSIRFGGKVTQASDKGKMSLSAYRKDDWDNQRSGDTINNSSLVQWKTEIEPGECFKPEIDYEFLLRQ